MLYTLFQFRRSAIIIFFRQFFLPHPAPSELPIRSIGIYSDAKKNRPFLHSDAKMPPISFRNCSIGTISVQKKIPTRKIRVPQEHYLNKCFEKKSVRICENMCGIEHDNYTLFWTIVFRKCHSPSSIVAPDSQHRNLFRC